MNNFIKISALLGIVFLSACAPIATKKIDQNILQLKWREQQQQLATIGDWQLQAKALLRSENGSGNVSLFWQHQQQSENVKILLPFARGSFVLQQDATGAKLVDNQGKVHRGATMTGLLWQKTGMEIPFADLQNWVIGKVAALDNKTVQVDEQARTLEFSEGDWQLQYPAYMQVSGAYNKEWQLPRKVYIFNKRLGDKFALKLSILNWQLKAK